MADYEKEDILGILRWHKTHMYRDYNIRVKFKITSVNVNKILYRSNLKPMIIS